MEEVSESARRDKREFNYITFVKGRRIECFLLFFYRPYNQQVLFGVHVV